MLLEVNNVSKTIKSVSILKDISFSVSEGEIVGFIGPNGAGKSTTLKIVLDLIRADNGEVRINDINVKKNRREALKYVGAIIESPSLYKYLTGYDNLEFIRKIRKLPKAATKEAIEQIKLNNRIKDRVYKYSLGMKQRLALGMALIGNPKLLILDEPTNGLDPTGIIELKQFIKETAKNKNTAVLVSSHQLLDIEQICDRFIFIKEGSIVGIFTKEEITDKYEGILQCYESLMKGEKNDYAYWHRA
jgi:ABC-2 type transport system ATP-binding protein